MAGQDAATIAQAIDPKARRGANGEWAARCPCHDDREASFSIRDAGERVVFTCFAGCDQRALADELLRRGLLGGQPRERKPRVDYSSIMDGISQENWHPEMPVPPEAPAPPATHPRLGAPSYTWTYLDDDGELLGFVLRFDPPGRGKQFQPLTYGTLNGRTGWHWKQMPTPRPLYKLRDLAERPEAPVLVCEGEKAADAAAKLFPGYVTTCWLAGSNAVDKAYWDSLAGRKVVIWPDADNAGHKAAGDVAGILGNIAAGVRIVELPKGLPEKWDLADPAPEGVDIHELLRGAPEAEPEWKSELDIIDPTKWQGLPIPERRWYVKDWIREAIVAAIYGNGGTGKSLLLQMLLTASAIGAPWLGLETKPCRAIGFFCEDDRDELWRRQDDINLFYGVEYKDLGNLQLVSRVHLDNILMDFSKEGAGAATKLHDHLLSWSQEFGAEAIGVDTAADTFGGNENSRKEVRQFVQKCLGALVRATGGTVILAAHPSVAGMESGTGGSTGWNNSVRSRMHLHLPPREKDVDLDPDLRILELPKTNYSRLGSSIALRWQNGVFRPEDKPAPGKMERNHCKDVFLRLLAELTEAGIRVGKSPQGSYAPKEMAKSPNSGGYRRADFERAMNDLIAEKRIKLVEIRRDKMAFVACEPEAAKSPFPFTAEAA